MYRLSVTHDEDARAKAMKRIRNLLDLATRATTPLEEARSAALEACRTLVRHGFHVVDRVVQEAAKDQEFRVAVERAVEEKLAELHRARGTTPTEAEIELRRAVARGAGKGAERIAEEVAKEGISWLFGKGRRR